MNIQDLLFRPRQPTGPLSVQQAHESNQQLTSTTTSPSLFQQQQPLQHYSTCPGVCLNVLVASFRCQNAIQAPCPAILQKCCEMDRVSFNGTPVETSAPIFNGDNDTNSTAPVAYVPKSSVQDKGDEAEGSPEDMRLQTTSNDSSLSSQQQHDQQQDGQRDASIESTLGQQQQQAATSMFTVPRLYPTTESPKGIDELKADEQQQQQHKSTSNIQLHDDHQSRSVYFLSSGVDPTTPDEQQPQQHQNSEQQDGKYMEQQQHKFLSSKSQTSDLAQSASDNRSSASQSFDTPLSTTTTTPTTVTSSRPSDRIVVIQTINGTTYLHNGQVSSSSIQSFMRQHSRPLYANWSDYQQLMMHSRLPHQNSVVYHSNIDPVRRYSLVSTQTNYAPNSNNNSLISNDLNSSQQQQSQQHSSGSGGSGEGGLATPKSAASTGTETSELDLKVLKDQHSAGSRQPPPSNNGQSNQNNERTISTSITTTSTPATTTTTTESLSTTMITTTQSPASNTEFDTTTTSGSPFIPSEQLHDEQTSSNAEQNGDPSSASVSGIANFLGTLFDSFMSSPNEGGGQNEARAPASDSSSASNGQQNDRRLGLDLSFRQQNDMVASQAINNNFNQSHFQGGSDGGANLMTSDGGSDLSQGQETNQQLPRCNGYCSLDQFLHLCDSHYPSSDCARSQKCCVTSVGSTSGDQQQQVTSQLNSPSASSSSSSSSTPNQICRGTCLPIYHSSLCMKPNEIQLDTLNCLPSQLCCSQPSSMVDGNNHLEDANGADSDSSLNTLGHHQSVGSTTNGAGGTTDGSMSSKDQSLSVALVPPPPPTIMTPSGLMDTQQMAQSTTNNRYAPKNLGSINPYQIAQTGLTSSQQPQFPPTPRPQSTLTSTTKSNSQQQTQQTAGGGGGGFMNQIFQMFKSNSGLTKQRTRQQSAPQQPTPAHNMYEPQIYHRQLVNFNPGPQMVASASNLGPTIQSAPNQQAVSYTSLQHQTANGGPTGPIMMAPNGQSFVATMPNPQTVTNYQTLAGGLQNMNKQVSMPAKGNNNNNNVQQTDPAHPFITDPVQYAAMLQKQYGQQANKLQPQQQQQQLGVNQLQLHSHPSAFALSAASEQQQQQLALMNAANQMNYMNQHHLQQQQLQQNQNQNRATYQPARLPQVGQQQQLAPAPSASASSQAYHQHVTNYQQQPSRWTYSTHLSPSDPALASANALQQQQPPRPQQQQQQAPLNNVKQIQHQSGGGGTMSFGPADAASALQQSQPNFKPVVGHGNGQHGNGWTGTTTGQGQENMEQQQYDKRLRPLVSSSTDEFDHRLQPVVASKPHNPEADADIVSAMTDQQQQQLVVADKRMPQQQHQLQPNTRVGSHQAQQQKSGYLPKIIPTSSTTTTTTTTSTLPPVRNTDQHQSSLSLSSSNLSPIHANTDDDGGVTVLTDSGDDVDPSLLVSDDPMGSAQQHVATATPNVAPSNARPGFSSNQANDADLATTDDEGSTSDSLDGLAIASSASASNQNTNNPTSSAAPTVSEQNEAALAASRSKVVTTACGLPGPSRLDLRLNSVASRARSGRVMGGFESEPGYWCWQAALMNDKNEYLCGGALIGTKWVLTAAHCVTQHLRSESQLYVRLGQSNLNTTSMAERRAARNVMVKTSYVHHNHNGITLDNDIALLRLNESIDLSEPNICTICLPERKKQLEPGRRCTVTGYGYETEQGPAALRVRQTDLPLVADQECQTKLGTTLQKPFVLPASSFCAGGEPGQDACHGDGGSPLSCLVDGYYVLEGLVSWGYGCGKMSGLFAKVSNFVGWINQIVSVNS